MRGLKVIVRCFGGEPRICQVWEATNLVVYVSDGNGMNRLLRGEDAPLPIGFSRQDVFGFEAGWDLKIKKWGLDWSSFPWEHLQPI